MTAIEQGLFVIDKQGIIRHVIVVGPIDPVPAAAATRRPGPPALRSVVVPA